MLLVHFVISLDKCRVELVHAKRGLVACIELLPLEMRHGSAVEENVPENVQVLFAKAK